MIVPNLHVGYRALGGSWVGPVYLPMWSSKVDLHRTTDPADGLNAAVSS
jgi:hypothetical protein